MENIEKEGLEIDLKQLLTVLWQRAWLICLVGVLCAAVTFCYAWFFITPTYSASTQLYVNNNYVDSPGFSSSQLSAAQELAETYMVILESRSVLVMVAEKAGLNYSYGQLKSMISAQSVNGTEVFEVTVTCTDYKHAALIANSIAAVLPDKIASVVEGSSVRVVDYAVENPYPVGPSYQRYLLLGAAVGILLTAVVVAISGILDTTISSEDYLYQVYSQYPLLVVIPSSEYGKSSYSKGYYKGNYESEQRHRPAGKQGGASK